MAEENKNYYVAEQVSEKLEDAASQLSSLAKESPWYKKIALYIVAIVAAIGGFLFGNFGDTIMQLISNFLSNLL